MRKDVRPGSTMIREKFSFVFSMGGGMGKRKAGRKEIRKVKRTGRGE